MRAAGRSTAFVLCLGGCFALLFASVQTSARQSPAPVASSDTRTTVQPVLDKYCITCHNQRLRTGGFILDTANAAAPADNPELWERVIAKLRARSMPPAGLPRPDPATYDGGALEIEDNYAPREIRLNAGDLILYPSTTLHRVTPVTRGERLAVVGWVQSFIRSQEQREVLFDLDQSIATLEQSGAQRVLLDRLTKARSNLLRLWAGA